MTSIEPPFAHVLVPYDGSEPARVALRAAIALGVLGAKLYLTTVVDETALIADSASTMTAYDPSPIMDELDARGKDLLDEAKTQCRASGVEASSSIVHDRPVSGILASCRSHACDLVIMGTHARSGVARLFLGSTTQGVLRLSRVPVLTVRTADRTGPAPFAAVLLAVDDSEPSDAAARLAGQVARSTNAKVTACYVVDTVHLYENSASYGFDPEPLVAEMHDEGQTIVKSALTHAGLPPDTSTAIVEGEPTSAIIATAEERGATLIMTGTHRRRGLLRFVLGSVAEGLVRTSDVPVLVVPVPSKAS
jgi:nucleotide-binding universal stress UspA family protein